MMEPLMAVNAAATVRALEILPAAFYSILVVAGYLTEGSAYRFRFDPRFPIHSLQRLLVGLGVWTAAGAIRIAGVLLAPLYEASAEVGEWAAQRTSSETQARLRSRYI